MTMTATFAQTKIPTKTDEMSWDLFTLALQTAATAEEQCLARNYPTPEITAERGTPQRNEQWFAQRGAADTRAYQLTLFHYKLIVEVGRALAAAVPNFRSLDIEYEGSGDNGEGCEITVYTDRPMKFDAEGKWVRPTAEESEEFTRQHDAANNILPSDLREWMDEICWSIAYHQHPGFEINEGGYGTITVEPADEDEEGSPLQLRISHTQRIEETEEEVPV